MTADSVPAPMVQLPADKLEALREAVANYRTATVARFQMGQTADPMTEIELAAGALVDAATPAAPVPAADIPRVARSLSDLKPGQVVALTRRSIDRRRIGTIRSVGNGGAMLQLEGDDLRSQSAFSFDVGEWVILEDTTPAVEQADKGEAADTPTCDHICYTNTHRCTKCGDEVAPAAPPEPLCHACGHKQESHGNWNWPVKCLVVDCRCVVSHADLICRPRVPVNDEAEAAWDSFRRNCYLDPAIDTPATRRAWIAGYRARAARGLKEDA